MVIGKFNCDGKNWNSVEHYYQANKFKNTNPLNGFYDEFSLDSGSELSINPLMAKSAGEKDGKFEGKQIRPKFIKIDDKFNEKSQDILKLALNCKFNQIPLFKDTLLATNNAKLIHFVRAKEPEISYELMRLRDSFKL